MDGHGACAGCRTGQRRVSPANSIGESWVTGSQKGDCNPDEAWENELL